MMSKPVSRRSFLLGTAGLASAAVLAACGGGSTPEPTSAPVTTPAPGTTPAAGSTPTATGGPVTGGIFTHAQNRYPLSFNALNPPGGVERWVNQLSSARLVNYDVAKNLIPDLAESWEFTDTTYTFNLRRDVVWSDGTPFTAKDVEITFNWGLNPNAGSEIYFQFTGLKGAQDVIDGNAETAEGIKVLDDYTIQFETDGPDATFLTSLAGYYGPYILPYHIIKDIAPEDFAASSWNTTFPRVSLGPFILTAAEKDQFVEYERNDRYFGGKPYLDKWVTRIIPDENVALAALLSGEVDMAGIPGAEYANVRANPAIETYVFPVYLWNGIMFREGVEHLADPRVRAAFLHALDRQAFVDTIIGGLGTVQDSIIVQEGWLSPNIVHYEYDPDKARQLLADAGWDASRTVEFKYFQNFDAFAPVLQASLADVGVTINPVRLETGTWVEDVVGNSNFELSVVGGGGMLDDPHELSYYFAGDSWSRYVNDEVSTLFEQGRTTVDTEARKPIYHRIQEIINRDLPWAPVWAVTPAVGFTRRTHYVAYAQYDYLYFHQWWVEPR